MFSKGQNKGHDIFFRRFVVDVPSSAPNHNAHWRRLQKLRDTECSTGIIEGNDDERYIISTPITTLLLLQLSTVQVVHRLQNGFIDFTLATAKYRSGCTSSAKRVYCQYLQLLSY